MLKYYTVIFFLNFISILNGQQHISHHSHHQEVEPYVISHGKIPRSVVDSHPNGSARTCTHEDDLIKWLPKDYVLRNEEGHYHLLLLVNDQQLPILINWLGISFAMGYLPSHRLMIHFHCDGPASKRFVETHLLQVKESYIC